MTRSQKIIQGFFGLAIGMAITVGMLGSSTAEARSTFWGPSGGTGRPMVWAASLQCATNNFSCVSGDTCKDNK